jgi:hypothetical protein
MVHAMDAGAKEVMYERLREGRGPRHSDNWNGMIFHWEVLDRPGRSRNDETGQWENITRPRILPTKFLGISAGDQPGLAGMQAPLPAHAPLVDNLDPISYGKVKRAAVTSGTYEEWVDVCLEITDSEGRDIMDQPEIGRAVADKSTYEALRKG